MSLVISILNALIALPKIGSLVEKFCAAVSAWWISRQTSETMKAIADAAAFSARAKTDEDRYKGAELWRSALSRDRVS